MYESQATREVDLTSKRCRIDMWTSERCPELKRITGGSYGFIGPLLLAAFIGADSCDDNLIIVGESKQSLLLACDKIGVFRLRELCLFLRFCGRDVPLRAGSSRVD